MRRDWDGITVYSTNDTDKILRQIFAGKEGLYRDIFITNKVHNSNFDEMARVFAKIYNNTEMSTLDSIIQQYNSKKGNPKFNFSEFLNRNARTIDSLPNVDEKISIYEALKNILINEFNLHNQKRKAADIIISKMKELTENDSYDFDLFPTDPDSDDDSGFNGD